MAETVDEDRKKQDSVFSNIREVLEAHLVLKNISPDLSFGLLEAAGRSVFDFEGIDSLFEVVASQNKGGDRNNAD